MLKTNTYKFGLFAEYFLILYLMFRGYKILSRRFKTKVGEIDILAIKNKVITVFEVKARKSGILNTSVVKKTQKDRIYNALKIFLSRNNKYIDYNILFSIILYRNICNFKIIKG